MIKGVLFDIGSTLIEGPAVSPAKQISVMLCGDYALKEEVAGKIMTTNLRSSAELQELLSVCYPAVLLTERERVQLDTLWKEQSCGASAKEGALELFQQCRNLGLKTGLISNIWHPYYSAFERCLPDIARGVECRSLSYEVGAIKPDVTLFHHALDAAGLQPEEVVIIGDSYDCDIEPALKLGMKTVWFLHRFANEQAFISDILNKKRALPHLTIGSLDELKKEELLKL